MGGVLAKRFLRELRENFGRYLALSLVIALGVYLVSSIVGSAEVVLRGTEQHKSIDRVEDGCFTVFLPLTDDEIDKLTVDGAEIEPHFSMDIPAADGTVLRLFRNREQIDKISLDSGAEASQTGEAVLEKNYASVHGLSVGDSIRAADTDFRITGIGSVPDYDTKLAQFSDPAVDNSSFGLLFVTDEQYRTIRDSTAQRAEEYTYAYRLGSESHETLKARIKDLELDYTKIEDRYFQETIAEVLDERREIEDGVRELNDGADALADGLGKLKDAGGDLNDAADALFQGYLDQANQSLAAMKQKITLTPENYADTLDQLVTATKSKELAALKESLDSIAAFRSGIRQYTDGTADAADGADDLADGTQTLQDKSDELLDEIFQIDIHNLTSFIKAEDNTRIAGAAGDVIMDKNAGLIAGIIVLILFAYVISVFVVHQIEREQAVIGALYALGVCKRDLLLHYIALQTLIAAIGGALGIAAAMTLIGIASMIQDTYSYFSTPIFPIRMPAYLIVYAIVVPPVISAAVNALIINKKLSGTALSMMKNEQSAGSYRQFRVKSKNFVRIFSIRQLARESRSAAAIVLGMLFSVMVCMLGLDCYVMCDAVRQRNTTDTKYEYMYLYKYPEKSAPAGSEAAYIETLSTDCMGYTLDVSVIGLDGESRYFSARPEKGTAKAVINNSLHERYGYEVGDRFVLRDEAAEKEYCFTVTDICDYAPGFTVFMNIDSMRELFGEDEDYFNAVYSDRALDIDEGRLYAVTTKDDIARSSAVFVDMMWPMIVTLTGAGTIILCVVMYLMTGVMIDRSAFGISLIKIFGYRAGEIRKLYLYGNFAVVAIGGLIVIPVAKKLMDTIFPLFIPNVACTMQFACPWYFYAAIYALLLLIYLGASALLTRKIKKITPAEVLKNRE